MIPPPRGSSKIAAWALDRSFAPEPAVGAVRSDRHVVDADRVVAGKLRLVPELPARQPPGRQGFLPAERVLQRPSLPADVVGRGDLIDVLRENAHVPVVLVTASPGFGKTTLIAEWDDEDPRPFTWVTVDATCNDPFVFVTYLALALQRVTSADPGVISALADQSDLTSILLPRFGRMLTTLTEPFVLVVDDAGALSAPGAFEVLSTVADHLGAGSQLVVSGRASP